MSRMSETDVRAVLLETGAILEGHFQLTSGRHSDTYVQCARVLEDPGLASQLASEIAGRFEDEGIEIVASPAVGGIVLGFAVAQALCAGFVFAERVEDHMAFRRGFAVPGGACVLIVEDVVTTGGSVAEVAGLVRDAGAEVVGVAAIIDRGGAKTYEGPTEALLHLGVASWDPAECAMCAEGRPVDAPGSRGLA